jgi:prephenate dehydrogenase
MQLSTLPSSDASPSPDPASAGASTCGAASPGDAASQRRRRQRNPTIGLLGFGAFGRLIATHLRPYFALTVHDPQLQQEGSPASSGLAVADAASAAGCDIVILAVPVDRLRAALVEIRPHLRPGALVVDVGSVKLEPERIMREELPETVDILCSHPLFGPQSASDGLAGLKIALCPIRGRRSAEVAAFLRRVLRLEVILTTPDAHDRELALVQGLTHLIAKVLVGMEPLPTRMTTRSFELLMRAVDMVRPDAPGVFLAIERDNPHARDVRRRFFGLAQELQESLDRHP